MTYRLSGIVAAPFTPFGSDGELRLEMVPCQAALLAHNRVSGAFICGTTGEGASLSTEERKRVATAWLAGRKAGLAVIVHVGHNSLTESIDLTRHAASVGADAIATIAPGFFKPADARALVDWCARVAAAAPTLPFYYYHMPSMTGCTASVVEFLKLAEPRIPNLAGVKFTHENLVEYAQAAEFAGGRYDLLFGRDELLLAGLVLGAQGAVGSTYNYLAPLYHTIIAEFAAGNLAAARAHQIRAMRLIDCLLRYGVMAAGKAAMKFCGVDCGAVRPPLSSLTAARESLLQRELEAEGFLEWCSRVPGAPATNPTTTGEEVRS